MVLTDAGGQERYGNPKDMLERKGSLVETVWLHSGYTGWSEKPGRNHLAWNTHYEEGILTQKKKL